MKGILDNDFSSCEQPFFSPVFHLHCLNIIPLHLFFSSIIFIPDLQLAALRLAKYWEKRLEIFGPSRAFQPLTQKQALKDDAVAMSYGFFTLMPVKEPSGRALVFIDPSKQDKSKYERESMARCLWYVIHVALEDEETQKKGLVGLLYPKKAKLTQLDRALAKLNMEAMKGCLPIRVSAMHLCHPPTFFRIVFPIFKLFMGERIVKRFRVHSGSEGAVLEKLASFGLSKDLVPTELGGNVVLDHKAWVAERKAGEK